MLAHTTRSAVLVVGALDTRVAGNAALAVPGVACVTTDPEKGQVLVRYDPDEVGADRILRAVRPDLPDEESVPRMLLSAWPTLAKAIPAAATLL
jgi:copper chaperone CopZ